MADIVQIILVTASLICIFGARELFGSIDIRVYNIIFLVLSILYFLAVVDDVRQWTFTDLKLSSEAENEHPNSK